MRRWKTTGEKPRTFAELHYVEISEESTRLANFLSGKLDIGTFNLESVAQLEEKCADCKFKTFTTGAQLFINIHGNLYIDREDLPTPRDPQPALGLSQRRHQLRGVGQRPESPQGYGYFH